MANNKILIIDDNQMNLKLLKVLLSSELYELRLATSALEALDILNTFHPKLILVDIQLPGMDGLEFTIKVKGNKTTNDITVVALTAFSMKEDEEKAKSAGCDGFIAKPIDIMVLPVLVRNYMK
jgi:two-component system cell cycle response regulator DivK